MQPRALAQFSRPRAQTPIGHAEWQFFKRCSRQRAIEFAALSKREDGSRHPHQNRIPEKTLAKAEKRLQKCAPEIQHCRSFDELHDLICQEFEDISGIGKLTRYDIATRIGAHLGLEPKLVYLHAGAAAAAKRLGFHGDTIDPNELPAAFHRLRPDEIEDCLCVYLQ
jgi:hypothetical protein